MEKVRAFFFCCELFIDTEWNVQYKMKMVGLVARGLH
jgi:hypothetical protein